MLNLKMTEKIMKTVDEVIEKEITEAQLLLVINKKKIEAMIDANMEIISKNFDDKCKFYKKSPESVSDIKQSILDEYMFLFADIEDEYVFQLTKLIDELKEAQANQKIALTNYKKVLSSKDEYIESPKYKEYMAKLQELIAKRESTEDKKTYAQLSEYIAQLGDPVEEFNKKIDALADKYGNYCALENNCIDRINESLNSVTESMSSVMQFEVGKLVSTEGKKSFIESIKALFSNLFKKGNFEKDYISKKKQEIETLKKDIDSLLDKICDVTATYMAMFDENKAKINKKYEVDVA